MSKTPITTTIADIPADGYGRIPGDRVGPFRPLDDLHCGEPGYADKRLVCQVAIGPDQGDIRYLPLDTPCEILTAEDVGLKPMTLGEVGKGLYARLDDGRRVAVLPVQPIQLGQPVKVAVRVLDGPYQGPEGIGLPPETPCARIRSPYRDWNGRVWE